MKIRAVVAAAFAALFLFAGAARAQAPTTIGEFKSIVLDSIKTGQALKAVESNIVDVTNRWNDFAGRAQYHQEHPCYYEPGHPEQCAQYDQEAKDLMAEGNRLVQEHDGYVAQRGYITSHFGVQMARLKLAKFFGAFGPWVERVQNCARMQSILAATICLAEAWEVHP